MHLSDTDLLNEAVQINHGTVHEKTLSRYQKHLEHFSFYLASVHEATFYDARRRHIRLFMAHLTKKGGAKPHLSRQNCQWCRQRGYPDGRRGPGWSASYRKSYLSAIRFLYKHFAREEDLPDRDPSAYEPSPRVVCKYAYIPSSDEVRRFIEAPGTPRDCLLAIWMAYCPSRRATFAHALWRDVDLEAGTWRFVGKNQKVQVYPLHPLVARELRLYRRWQLEEAKSNPQMRATLSNTDTAYVLMTKHGRPVRPESIAKMIKWRAIRAGLAVRDTNARWDSPAGKTSPMSPHAMRRAWAKIALNEQNIPIDVVSGVLGHADISTTRRHYAPTESDRVSSALLSMSYRQDANR